MNDPYQPTEKPAVSVHLPLMFLALAIAVFLSAQIVAATQGGKTMRWQLGNLEKQSTNIDEAQKQLDEMIVKREDLVKQSTAIQTQYTNLLNDVLELAKDDEDAKKVIEKWKIQRSAPPATTGDAPAAGSAGADQAK